MNKDLSPPLFIEEVAQAKRSDGGVKAAAVGADRCVCPTRQQQGNDKGEHTGSPLQKQQKKHPQ